ncbi:5,6-dimethylbenzimidazole synthase [Roseospira visakhapatnamensis]|uniref:5,6-dimethylbenzimidazole synthase n=1 Tax=Roseospira visakhapatnamensis TaxID=390880 RepID=A0A7W6RBY0_9PROT|nr:5,6-dimethylbenzimidazole synthase [Roseospira visakhapatnamensis]MBB4265557.1 5,6-dimethylbenzimidazole synthase [Roseospira visakhapatnamensis]
MSHPASDSPRFDPAFQDHLETLFRWRRDIRHFRTDPLPAGLLEDLVRQAALAPSVGNAQPWRFVSVADPARRAAITANFERETTAARATYDETRAAAYDRLKLEGLREAPVHLAVFCDDATDAGHGLGRRTMPETLRYSVVGAIQQFWLAARARDVAVGWVSILDPEAAHRDLEAPASWTLIAYLCVGWPAPETDSETPELVRAGWQGPVEDARRLFIW